MRTRTKLAIVGACLIAGAAVDGSTALGSVHNPSRAEIEELSNLVILPVIADCDSPAMVELADELITQGWRSDGVSDLFGEALVDPTGHVVVRWEC